MASKGFSADFAATARSTEPRESGPLPTLLSATRRRAPADSVAGGFAKAQLEIAIPESENLWQSYPAEAVHVRNTFIHVVSPAMSLQRATMSCPSSQIGRLQDTFKNDEEKVEQSVAAPKQVICLSAMLDEPAVPSTPEPLSLGRSMLPPSCYSSPEKLSALTHSRELVEGHAVGSHWQGTVKQPEHLAQQVLTQGWFQGPAFHSAPHSAIQMVPPLSAPPALPVLPLPAEPTEPAPGSAELPSIGSKLHFLRDCKPCAFLHAKGCDSGAMCKFCHLCDAGEKKKRQKAKKIAFRLGGA